MNSGEGFLGQGPGADGGPVTGKHVDDAVGQAGFPVELHQVVRREHLGLRGLPDDGVPHDRRSHRQVPAESGEVERAHREDESLEGAILEVVPDAGVGLAHRLLPDELVEEIGVEPQHVRELAGRFNLRLMTGLRLAQHGGGVHPVAAGADQQVGHSQVETGARPVVEFGPGVPRIGGGGHRLVDDLRGGLVVASQNVRVVVRRTDFRELPRTDLLPPDDDRDFDDFVGLAGDFGLERRALRACCLIAAYRLVVRSGDGLNSLAH